MIVMKTFGHIVLVVIMVFITSSCTIRHSIEKDYPQYLAKNVGNANLPKTDKASEYFLTPATQQYSYEFRAVVTGYANLWIVDFGKMLDDTLMSEDVQNAFGHLEKTLKQTADSNGLLIFDLRDFKFEGFAAHISLKISLYRLGNLVFTETYTHSGKSQGAKMFWGGAFAQKNAVQQSTKLALDEIMRQLIADLNTYAG